MERSESFGPKRSETEKRKSRAQFLYDFEIEVLRHGWGVYPGDHNQIESRRADSNR
jgi:hypothetical protein